MPFYAVAEGSNPGIYNSWSECEGQVSGYSGARYKKFDTMSAARDFVQDNSSHSSNAGPSYSPQKRTHYDAGNDYSGGGSSYKKQVSTDSDGYPIAYTDGSCEYNGQCGAKAGVGVYFGRNNPMNVSKPVSGRATNNVAEIEAATHAVEQAKASGYKKLAVHTDSQFMVDSMNNWAENWRKNDWVKSDGTAVKNKEQFIALDKAAAGLDDLKWVKVKGHAGIAGNEAADKLARQGAKHYKA